jgi:predicted nucleic acid-binding protein
MGFTRSDLQQGQLIALDTSLFIYLIERNPDFYRVVAPIFEAIDNGEVRAVTSVLTLLEVLVKPIEAGATALVEDFRARLADGTTVRVIPVDRIISERAAAIRAKYRYRTPDAVHLATAMVGGAHVFVTNDARLQNFGELKVMTLK